MSANDDYPPQQRYDENPRAPRGQSRSPTRNGEEGGDRGRNGNSGSDANNPGMNLHVSGLMPKVDAEALKAHFETIASVEKASVMYDPHTKESRGFGFVMMFSPEDAQRAIDALNQREFNGKIMTVAHARRARARTPTPGRYYGPPKTGMYSGGGGGGGDRYYEPRSYDSRYQGGSRGYDDRDRGGYDRGYDRGGDRGGRYDDRDRSRYDDRRDSRYDDRRSYDRGGYDYSRDGRGAPPAERPAGGSSSGYRDDRGYDRSRY